MLKNKFFIGQTVYFPFQMDTTKHCPDCDGKGIVELKSGKMMKCSTCGGDGYVLGDLAEYPTNGVVREIYASPERLFYTIGIYICPENEVFQTLEECQAYCDMESK